jgi:hypothetical protein
MKIAQPKFYRLGYDLYNIFDQLPSDELQQQGLSYPIAVRQTSTMRLFQQTPL